MGRGLGGGVCDRIAVFIEALIGAEAIRNPPFLQIIRRHFHTNLVTGEDAYAVDAHSPRKVAEQFVIFGLRTEDFNLERGIRKRFDNETDEFDYILRHNCK